MFSEFFIRRPIFASVISIVIVIAGIVTLGVLPIEQYPEITPPTVEVSASYPGASAEVVAETVAAPIEQEVNGVEGMIYMSSTSASDGSYTLTVTFEVGSDLDLAQILVQNRVTLAEPNLPEEVVRQGVSTKKKSSNIILISTLVSEDPNHDVIFLSNYATLNLRDTLSRIVGVGEVFIFPPSDYSMRVWLDPGSLKSRGLTTQEVVSAIREQNVQVAAGQIGQPPAPSGQAFQFSVNVLGRLTDIAQFEDIIVKYGDDGGITYLKDIARVELGGQSYDITSALSGSPAAAIAIYQLPGANAIAVKNQVSQAMKELSRNFPMGMSYEIPYDTTIFVETSIQEVYVTLFQAAGLVFLVLFLFLQDWRATIIPAVTIPVSLIGTFAVMGLLGYSLNMLTLFGIVLAIGIVVDDAIVVVEATAVKIDNGLSAMDAAIEAMREVSGPVVATTLVLLAVFIPSAFLPGITGQMYRQFAVTIAVATVFSSVNALTMAPALAALMLRPQKTSKNFFFRGFDQVFAKSENGYMALTKKLTRITAVMMLLFVGLGGYTFWQFGKLPTAFLPVEDQGYVIVSAQLPNASALERTTAVLDRIDTILADMPGVADWVSLGGYSVIDGTNASNAATVFVTMTPWDERQDPQLSQAAILGRLQGELAQIQEAIAFAFPPPAIPGLGVAGGFQMQLQDRGALGLQELQRMSQEILADGNAQSGLNNLNTTFRADVPQLFAEVDRTKAKSLGISLNEVFGTLQTYLGSAYVNDFNKFGRTWQVKVQADHKFRVKPEDITKLDPSPYTFSVVPNSYMMAKGVAIGIAKLAEKNGWKSYATIASDYAWGRSSQQVQVASLKKLAPDLELVEEFWPPLGHTGFNSFVVAIKNRKPDFVLASIAGADNTRWDVAVKDYRLADETAIVGGLISLTELVEQANWIRRGTYGRTRAPFFAHLDVPMMVKFVETYRARYDRYPSDWAVMAYDGVIALKQGIDRAGSIDTDQVKEALTGMAVDSTRGSLFFREIDNQLSVSAYFGRVADDPAYDFPIYADLVEMKAPDIWRPEAEIFDARGQ